MPVAKSLAETVMLLHTVWDFLIEFMSTAPNTLSSPGYPLLLRAHSLVGRVKLDSRATRLWAVLCGGPVRRWATTHVTRTATA